MPGYWDVTFKETESAETATESLDKFIFAGSELTVKSLSVPHT